MYGLYNEHTGIKQPKLDTCPLLPPIKHSLPENIGDKADQQKNYVSVLPIQQFMSLLVRTVGEV